MASAKALLGSVLGRFLFTDSRVTQVHERSRVFRQIDCEGPALKGQGWTPGDKVQVFLPGLGMRTYTPQSWDEERGATSFLVYLHGDSPGASWGRDVKVGDTVQFFGPRRSLSLEAGDAPVVLFGDETSFAVAYAFRTAARRDVTPLFEVTAPDACAPVLREMGFEGQSVAREPGDAHLARLHERLREAMGAKPGAALVMTGRAQSIQALRARLRGDGDRATPKVKAYWAVGKTGLD
ncbi:NADPH-dependent ferric siderophore reductase [Myxococcus xanthus]|uniref:NADPH-dependent ferric siderophore reductase n=1 Tax=Myxococcus xanthus TaxID=34 RepID=A0AAE6FY56_MYXXA|nr:siderophore-interacting protein [Myxococcus xanthus]QDE67352.1 NADPH-dependent ferric siderophore reductase [Myxococcus xanthus]QDE74628.1 NADPH-dependent ferric siderophore reductase [Myxococcus xanthus]